MGTGALTQVFAASQESTSKTCYIWTVLSSCEDNSEVSPSLGGSLYFALQVSCEVRAGSHGVPAFEASAPVWSELK